MMPNLQHGARTGFDRARPECRSNPVRGLSRDLTRRAPGFERAPYGHACGVICLASVFAIYSTIVPTQNPEWVYQSIDFTKGSRTGSLSGQGWNPPPPPAIKNDRFPSGHIYSFNAPDPLFLYEYDCPKEDGELQKPDFRLSNYVPLLRGRPLIIWGGAW